MSLQIGVDTYVDVASATDYIALHYTSTNPQRVAWNALPDEDKEVCLRNATSEMERLKFTGGKYDINQTLSFPRLCETVPNDIKYTQIEEALELASPTDDTKIANSYGSNKKSASISKVSETYGSCNCSDIRTIIKSKKAQGLLRQFMGGGFSVR